MVVNPLAISLREGTCTVDIAQPKDVARGHRSSRRAKDYAARDQFRMSATPIFLCLQERIWLQSGDRAARDSNISM